MMADNQTRDEQECTDFLISYAGKDRAWAEWIAATLEAEGYHTIIDAWDLRPGTNRVLAMDQATRQADRTLLVLSAAYLAADDETMAEWAVAFLRDPGGKDGRVLLVRVERCPVKGLLDALACIDLVDLSEREARERLLAGVKPSRAKPDRTPYLASTSSQVALDRVVFPPTLPPIWNVPYPQNALFTGREELLVQLESLQRAGQPTALSQPQAISGLGGVGKTQLALEYVYRHRHEYQAVLWAQADTHEALTSSYLIIARLLDLPEKEAPESAHVIAAVKEWLRSRTGWLLILNNADELGLAYDFLPPQVGGHVLLTTRAQAMGRLARRVEVEVLPTELGALFLLRRAGLLSFDAPLDHVAQQQQEIARAICEELGGLPLALDQVGAYVEETGCSLVEYLHLFQRCRADQLARRGGVVEDHPHPVATTWSLSFEQVERKNPAAADLLRVCALLAPDAIPETIVTEGTAYLGPQLASVGADPYQLAEAIEVLCAYSLLRRERSVETVHVLWVHRLVQAVVQDDMEMRHKKQWVRRVVRALDAAFPSVEPQHWSLCEQLVPHALFGVMLINGYGMVFAQAVHLLSQTGRYLAERACYQEAESLLQRALEICEQELGEMHPGMVTSLNNLGVLYQDQGKYAEAELLLQRAFVIQEQELREMHPKTAMNLNNLGMLYLDQGKDTEAELLLKRALEICEQHLGASHPDTATSLNNLGMLYQAQGKDVEAESFYERAFVIREQELGETHPDTAINLSNLALLYQSQRKYAEAELLLQRVLEICEQKLGKTHPKTATSLSNLASFYKRQGKYAEAEPLMERALQIYEQRLEETHPDTAQSLNNLAGLYWEQGKYAEAESLLQRALEICEQHLGAFHLDTAQSLNNLAMLYDEQGKYVEAEPLMERALQIYEQKLGATHPDMAQSLNNLAGLYQDQGKYAEAELLYERALAICERVLGQEDSRTQTIREKYATLLEAQGRDGV
jgi:tetratricopeptide (TPR) repeat protein